MVHQSGALKQSKVVAAPGGRVQSRTDRWGGARGGESVVIVNVTLLSIICGGASCRGQDLSGWCPAAVVMCSTPMGGPPQLWMTKLRVSCGFYELVVTSPAEKR